MSLPTGPASRPAPPAVPVLALPLCPPQFRPAVGLFWLPGPWLTSEQGLTGLRFPGANMATCPLLTGVPSNQVERQPPGSPLASPLGLDRGCLRSCFLAESQKEFSTTEHHHSTHSQLQMESRAHFPWHRGSLIHRWCC